MTVSSEITQLLQRVSAGDAAASEPLYRLVYVDLMRMAQSHLTRAGTLSMDAPALLHEAYLRLSRQANLPDANRHLFFAYASKAMRSVVIDHVRDRGARKRGAGAPAVTVSANFAESMFTRNSATEIESALQALEEVDARACRVVEMRYFGGLTEDAIARALEVSLPTVKRDWRKARAFLYEQLR